MFLLYIDQLCRKYFFPLRRWIWYRRVCLEVGWRLPELGTMRCPPWLLKEPCAVHEGSRVRAKLWFRRFMVSLFSSRDCVNCNGKVTRGSASVSMSSKVDLAPVELTVLWRLYERTLFHFTGCILLLNLLCLIFFIFIIIIFNWLDLILYMYFIKLCSIVFFFFFYKMMAEKLA